MKQFKIKIYGIKTFEINEKIISNDFDLSFSEDINAGQGGISIPLNLDFENTDFKIGDILEISTFDENNKNGLLRYSGVINEVERDYNKGIEKITLNCESIVNLLVAIEVNKTYTGTYTGIVNQIIADLPTNTCDMEFLGSNYFKNLIQDNSTAPNLVIDGNLLKALQELFKDKTFFINQFGEISDTFSEKHLLVFGTDIISNNIIEDKNGIKEVNLLINNTKNINCGDKIKIINSETFVNLDGQQITKLDFDLETQSLKVGQFKNLKI